MYFVAVGMWERTITISSASKSFSVTGWRVGWSIGPKELIDCLMIAHQNGTISCTTPAQEAIARCIELEIPKLNQPQSHFKEQLEILQSKRNMFGQVLNNTGFKTCIPDAGYFVLADWTSVATTEMIENEPESSSDFKFAMWLMKNYRIASIPPSAFFGDNKGVAEKFIRFCFFKENDVLEKAKKCLESMQAYI